MHRHSKNLQRVWYGVSSQQHEIDDDTTRSVVYVNLLTDGGTTAQQVKLLSRGIVRCRTYDDANDFFNPLVLHPKWDSNVSVAL